MKLRFIELNNIGLYKKDRITLSSSNKNEAILIWGNNGAGKTTFINSVKACMLGNKAYVMDYPEYCQFIRDSLISARCDKNDFNASITLGLTVKEKNKNVEYQIQRIWIGNEESFEETVEVSSNDKLLDYEEKEEFLNKLANIFTPSLLNVIVFDGEKAINDLNENHMDNLIKGIINSVFGMDVYANLVKDLNAYLSNVKSDSSLESDEQMYFINLENKYRADNAKIRRLRPLIEAEEKNRVACSRATMAIVKKFSEKTGISIDDVSDITENLVDIQKKKEMMNSDIKFINEEILPLKLLHKRIKKVLIDIEKDKPNQIKKNLDSIMDYFKSSDDAMKKIEFLRQLLPYTEDSKYDISEANLEVLKRIDGQLEQYNKEKLLSNYSKKNDFMDTLKEKIEIANKVEDEDSQKMLSEVENSYNKLTLIKEKIANLNEELVEGVNELAISKKEYDEFKAKLTAKKKESGSYINAGLYRDALEEFIRDNTKKICDQLNERVLKQLTEIKFRNSSIRKIEISPKNFDMKLYEDEGKNIPLNLFSAGEKQVLLGMVLKEAFDMTKVDTFFLFDTPVGRLDTGNREIFTNEVILKISEQIAVFATDSDYTRDDYNKLQNQFTKELKLCRNDNDEIVIKDGSIYEVN